MTTNTFKMKQLLIILLNLIIISCSKKIPFEYYSKVKNTLYLNNIQNEFYIKSKNKNIKVEITNATIERKDDTTYVIKTNIPQMSEMKISDSNKNFRKIYFYKLNVPCPELTFNGYKYYNSKVIKRSEARKISSFSSNIENFSYDLAFLNSEFEVMRIDSAQKVTYEKVIWGKGFYIFKKAEIGDIYIFYNIKIEVAKDEVVNGKELVLKIIE